MAIIEEPVKKNNLCLYVKISTAMSFFCYNTIEVF